MWKVKFLSQFVCDQVGRSSKDDLKKICLMDEIADLIKDVMCCLLLCNFVVVMVVEVVEMPLKFSPYSCQFKNHIYIFL